MVVMEKDGKVIFVIENAQSLFKSTSPRFTSLISLWFPSPYTSRLLSLLFFLLSLSQMNVLSDNSFHRLVNLR